MNAKTEKFVKQLETSSGVKLPSEERGDVLWLEADSAKMPAICVASLSAGAIFDSAFITPVAKSTFRVSYVFRVSSLNQFIVIYSEGQKFQSVSAKINAASWDERKMHDLTGVEFIGIPDERPILFHPDGGLPNLDATTSTGGKNRTGAAANAGECEYIYPMPGTNAEGEFQIPVGPVHAGIIEPGHFRFHVVGETINKMETRMFYLHRGVELAAGGKGIVEALPLVEQISGDECVANSLAYSQAVENALDIKCPSRAENLRIIFAELERIYSHLADLGGMPTDVGFTLAASRFAAFREDMLRINKALTGHRYLHGVCTPGGVSIDLDGDKVKFLLSELSKFSSKLASLERVTLSNPTYLDRVFSTGRVTKQDIDKLALVGPAARAGATSCDSRLQFPYLPYSKYGFSESMEAGGDVLSRFLVKLGEVKQSVVIINEAAKKLPSGSIRVALPASGKNSQRRVGLGWAEAPRGTCTFMVELDGDGAILHFRCRTASFRNWRAAERAVLGNIVPDFPLINKSFNLSYAGTDL